LDALFSPTHSLLRRRDVDRSRDVPGRLVRDPAAEHSTRGETSVREGARVRGVDRLASTDESFDEDDDDDANGMMGNLLGPMDASRESRVRTNVAFVSGT
jgi:hypothetical protein